MPALAVKTTGAAGPGFQITEISRGCTYAPVLPDGSNAPREPVCSAGYFLGSVTRCDCSGLLLCMGLFSHFCFEGPCRSPK
jgi:hypothetical protein